MAEDNSGIMEGIEPSAGSGGSPLKKLIIIPIVLLVLAAQTALAYFTMNYFFFSEQPPVRQAEAKEKKHEGESIPAGEIYQITDIIVNPAGTQGRRYLVVSLGMEVTGKNAMAEIQLREPQIRDALITLLSSKTLEFLADVLNRESMREEIMTVTNQFVEKGEVIRIYFIGYVLQ